ncbi:MAG: hypothetical protein M0R03_21530 [Novosphingobium sp.]|nr:hypothetical protein [Novosphingobium sp.]
MNKPLEECTTLELYYQLECSVLKGDNEQLTKIIINEIHRKDPEALKNLSPKSEQKIKGKKGEK